MFFRRFSVSVVSFSTVLFCGFSTSLHVIEKYTSLNFSFYISSSDCTFTSTQRAKLKEHCRTHTHEKSFSCPNCGGLFSNKTKFTDHLRRQNTMESKYMYIVCISAKTQIAILVICIILKPTLCCRYIHIFYGQDLNQPHTQALFSLKEETLMNAGHVAPRFLEPACKR